MDSFEMQIKDGLIIYEFSNQKMKRQFIATPGQGYTILNTFIIENGKLRISKVETPPVSTINKYIEMYNNKWKYFSII